MIDRERLWWIYKLREFTINSLKLYLRNQGVNPSKIYAQDLKSGDLFTYRDVSYKCIAVITDIRTTLSNIIACELVNNENITAIKSFRTFEFEVFGRVPRTITVLEVDASEVTPEQEDAFMRQRERGEIVQTK